MGMNFVAQPVDSDDESEEDDELTTDAKWLPPSKDQEHDEGEYHAKLRVHLVDLLEESESQMNRLYCRWRQGDMAEYEYLESKEQTRKYAKALLKANGEYDDDDEEDDGFEIVVPFIYASVQTIVTYVLGSLMRKGNVFPLQARKNAHRESSALMTRVLESDLQVFSGYEQLIRFIYDAIRYNLGVISVDWVGKEINSAIDSAELGDVLSGISETFIEPSLDESENSYEGSSLTCIDPFSFFPDTNVPFCDVAKEGEFAFWRVFKNRSHLRLLDSNGTLAHVKEVPAECAMHTNERSDSKYGLEAPNSKRMVQVDQGTVMLVPSDYGLGEDEGFNNPDAPQMFRVVLLNKTVIAYLGKVEGVSTEHPIAVTEPFSNGHKAGGPSVRDMLLDVQKTLSWLVTSRIEGTRTAMNQKLLINPNLIDPEGLTRDRPGAILAMGALGLGVKPDDAILDFTPKNPTDGHFNDVGLLIQVGDMIAATSDATRGQINTDRTTATEVRTATQAAGSRLALLTGRISAQGWSRIAELMLHFRYSFGDPDDVVDMFDTDEQEDFVEAWGNIFDYVVGDGTIPQDDVALFGIWTQLLPLLQGDQEIRATYSMPKVFDHLAHLGGVRSLREMRRNEGEQNAQPGIIAGDSAGGAEPTGGLDPASGLTSNS